MLYFKYKKFIKLFKIIKRKNDIEGIAFDLEEKYGKIAEEAISILRAKGGIVKAGYIFDRMNSDKMDAIILEYEERCSSMFWGCVKWTIGTSLSVGGLVVAYMSFAK